MNVERTLGLKPNNYQLPDMDLWYALENCADTGIGELHKFLRERSEHYLKNDKDIKARLASVLIGRFIEARFDMWRLDREPVRLLYSTNSRTIAQVISGIKIADNRVWFDFNHFKKTQTAIRHMEIMLGMMQKGREVYIIDNHSSGAPDSVRLQKVNQKYHPVLAAITSYNESNTGNHYDEAIIFIPAFTTNTKEPSRRDLVASSSEHANDFGLKRYLLNVKFK